MRKTMFALIALAMALFGTQCWAQSCNVEEESNCHTFTPTNTTNTYNFGTDGTLIVKFVTVLTSFDLRVRIHLPKPTDSSVICEGGPCPSLIPLDPKEFPPGTLCVNYGTSSAGECDQYDFTGSAGGPHGVPVRNKDYKGLITLTLTYDTSPTFTVRNPAFGHAPGDITTFTEDILSFYFQAPPSLITLATSAQSSASDPTMDGTTPGLSSVVALDESFEEIGDSFCSLTLQGGPPFHVGQEIEVDFRLTNGTDCSTGIRDKSARFSLSFTDSFGNFLSFPALKDKEEANRFHWDNKNKVNEFDLSTVGLAPGNYTITVFSRKISPQNVSFVLAP